VSSQNAGNVFSSLDRVRVGDQIQVFSGAQPFEYQVVDVRRVPRTDVSVVSPTETASISLITCTGAWLPAIGDYAQRLVVRAELVGGEAAAALPTSAATSAVPTLPVPLRTIYDERP